MIIDVWHRARGWSSIGYHFVITNGRPHGVGSYYAFLDGQVEPGLPIDHVGSHVFKHNDHSIGICLIGNAEFTNGQLMAARSLILELQKNHNVPIDNVLGHYEVPNEFKSCPNIPMPSMRKFISDTLSVEDLQKDIAQHNKKG